VHDDAEPDAAQPDDQVVVMSSSPKITGQFQGCQ
jgi:hypothetical protein